LAHKFKILSTALLNGYKKSLKIDLAKSIDKLKSKELPFKLDFYLASASTYSSNIEGNSTSLDSFLKYTSSKALKRTKEIKEIENLVKAYSFAKKNKLSKKNFLESHKILSKEFLVPMFRGKLRKGNVVVANNTGIVYVGIEPGLLKKEFDLFFKEIDTLLKIPLSIQETFYYASMIHVMFEKIHPFADGNGRAGRLLEKWFLSAFIPEKAWMIESEKYYFQKRNDYYKNLSIGFEYHSCDIKKSLPFLLMLPKAIK
jgi:Fic family protein